LTYFSCQTKTDLSNIKGIEIFLLKTECRNQNSYKEHKSISERDKFMEKHKSFEEVPVEKCANYIDLEKCKSEDKPFLKKADIEKFDWVKSKIYLTKSGIEKLKTKEIPLRGLAFVIKLNEKNVYAGWFWNMFSSFSCDRIYSYPNKNIKENELDLEFGLGVIKCGKDNRKDESLIRNILEMN
tara:strand:- start:901 stop:1449 length:549 start_codon:yes stop_codon:yes gene_type:complete